MPMDLGRAPRIQRQLQRTMMIMENDDRERWWWRIYQFHLLGSPDRIQNFVQTLLAYVILGRETIVTSWILVCLVVRFKLLHCVARMWTKFIISTINIIKTVTISPAVKWWHLPWSSSQLSQAWLSPHATHFHSSALLFESRIPSNLIFNPVSRFLMSTQDGVQLQLVTSDRRLAFLFSRTRTPNERSKQVTETSNHRRWYTRQWAESRLSTSGAGDIGSRRFGGG